MSRNATVSSESESITASAMLEGSAPSLRRSTARIPDACAPSMSCTSLSPTITVVDASVPSARSAAEKMSGDGLRQPTSAEKVTEFKVAVQPHVGELFVQRTDAVRRVRAQPHPDAFRAQSVEHGDSGRVDIRTAPPGLLLDAKHLVEELVVEVEARVCVGAS